MLLLMCPASERDVNKLWECFNDVAEGFGLNQDELVEICRSMQQTFEIHARSEMDQLSGALFTALDTDEVRCLVPLQRVIFSSVLLFTYVCQLFSLVSGT